MSKVKMRFSQRPGDAALMSEIRDELAGLMAKIMDCDSPRHAPLYAAWSAADCCARLLAEPPLPRQLERCIDDLPRGRPEAADIDLMRGLYRRAQALNVLLHPSAPIAAPILAVALAIQAAAEVWSGDPSIWREQRGA